MYDRPYHRVQSNHLTSTSASTASIPTEEEPTAEDQQSTTPIKTAPTWKRYHQPANPAILFQSNRQHIASRKMFRLRVFFRSSSNAIKSAMLEPVGTSSSSGGGSSCITSLRAQSTQVRTQLRPDAVIPPPHTVCSNCSKSTPTLESKAHLKVQQQQLGEQSPQWKPKCILLQPNPTEDLPWDPSDILSSRLTVTPEGKVRVSLGSRGSSATGELCHCANTQLTDFHSTLSAGSAQQAATADQCSIRFSAGPELT